MDRGTAVGDQQEAEGGCPIEAARSWHNRQVRSRTSQRETLRRDGDQSEGSAGGCTEECCTREGAVLHTCTVQERADAAVDEEIWWRGLEWWRDSGKERQGQDKRDGRREDGTRPC